MRVWLRAWIVSVLIFPLFGVVRGVDAGHAEDAECARLATTGLLQESGIDIGIASTATLTGCRQNAASEWFYPVDSDDPRLPGGPILTEQERQAAASVRATLLDQLAAFPPTLIGWMQESLAELRRKAVTPDGRVKPGVGVDLAGVGEWLEPYTQALITYLQDPNREEIDTYAAWWFERRQAAAPVAILQNQIPPAVGAIRGELQLDRPPWPWDLEDPVVLDEFLAYALDHGLILGGGGAQGSGASIPTLQDCPPELPPWLDQTADRMVAFEAIPWYFPSSLTDSAAEAQLRSAATSTRELSRAQARSIPPTVATSLGGTVVGALDSYAKAFDLLGDTSAIGSSEALSEGFDELSLADQLWQQAEGMLAVHRAACEAS